MGALGCHQTRSTSVPFSLLDLATCRDLRDSTVSALRLMHSTSRSRRSVRGARPNDAITASLLCSVAEAVSSCVRWAATKARRRSGAAGLCRLGCPTWKSDRISDACVLCVVSSMKLDGASVRRPASCGPDPIQGPGGTVDSSANTSARCCVGVVAVSRRQRVRCKRDQQARPPQDSRSSQDTVKCFRNEQSYEKAALK